MITVNTEIKQTVNFIVCDPSLDFDAMLAELRALRQQPEVQADVKDADELIDSLRDEPGYYESTQPYLY